MHMLMSRWLAGAFLCAWIAWAGISARVYAAAAPPIPSGTDHRFVMQPDGKISVAGLSFDSREAYLRSDYFRRTGRRCGTRLRGTKAASAHQRLAGLGDCTLSNTTIQSEYWPATNLSIPVVVHIIHRTDGTGNMDDARVGRQMEVLNEDFTAMLGTLGEDGYDTKIHFDLVYVTRTANNDWFADYDELGYKTALGWDQSRYCNIYLNQASGYLGYATLPQELAGVYDGLVIAYDVFGGRDEGSPPYDQGRTVVHEMGHYLGLFHTFEEEDACLNSYTNGDLVLDTPAERTAHYDCIQTTSCTEPDPIHNYMNYTPDSCMREFTREQANRMVCSLFNYRPHLLLAAPPGQIGLIGSIPPGDDRQLPFGGVHMGLSRMESITVTNADSANALLLKGIRVSNAVYAVTNIPATWPASIPAHSSLTFNVTYTPTTTATNLGTVVVDSNDTNEPAASMALSGYGLPDYLGVEPELAFSNRGRTGGPFTPGSMMYTLTNRSETALPWTASGTQPWVSLMPTQGTLAAGTTQAVLAAITAELVPGEAGLYEATLVFSNSLNGARHLRNASVTVITSPWMFVTPEILLATNKAGGVSEQFMVISNAQPANDDLDFTLQITNAEATAWLRVTPETGAGIPPGAAEVVTIAFEASGQPPGVYTGLIAVLSNDEYAPERQVECRMTVLLDSLGITPTGVATASGIVGGPFIPGQWVYVLTNAGAESLDWTVRQTSSWLHAAGQGTLAPGGFTMVTAAVAGSAADLLPVGDYADTLFFSNQTSGACIWRGIKLAARMPEFTRLHYFPMDTDPGWAMEGQWAFGPPQAMEGDPAAGFTGTNVLGYNLNGAYSNNMPAYRLATPPMDCSGYTSLRLVFRRWLGVEDFAFDQAPIEASTDGTHWFTVWANRAGTVMDAEWQRIELALPAEVHGSSTLRLRWVMGPTDDAITYCGWNLDDIEIWGRPQDGRVLLAVASEHGQPIPAAGVYLHALATQMAFSVNSPLPQGTLRDLCTGWTGTGSIPAAGTNAATDLITLTNDSTLTWNWTRQYWLDLRVNGSGTLSKASAWHNAGAPVDLIATPNTNYLFNSWMGDIDDCSIWDNELSGLMTTSRVIAAWFILDPASFLAWVEDHGMTGDVATLFVQVTNANGVAVGFEYAFGTNLPADGELLRWRWAPPWPFVIETPAQDSRTVPYVEIQLPGSSNAMDWAWPQFPPTATGQPPQRLWFTPADPPLEQQFFRLQGTLK